MWVQPEARAHSALNHSFPENQKTVLGQSDLSQGHFINNKAINIYESSLNLKQITSMKKHNSSTSALGNLLKLCCIMILIDMDNYYWYSNNKKHCRKNLDFCSPKELFKPAVETPCDKTLMVGFQYLCTQEFKLLLNSLSLVFWGVHRGSYLSGFPVVWPRTFMANTQLTVGFWWFQSCGTWLFNILYGLYPYLGLVGTFEDGTRGYINRQVWVKSLLALDLSPVISPENFFCFSIFLVKSECSKLRLTPCNRTR